VENYGPSEFKIAIPYAHRTCAADGLAPLAARKTHSTLCKNGWKEIGIMATNEVDRSADIYAKVAGTLMVILLAYGALSLLGVVR
jgi:hypothetical protein